MGRGSGRERGKSAREKEREWKHEGAGDGGAFLLLLNTHTQWSQLQQLLDRLANNLNNALHGSVFVIFGKETDCALGWGFSFLHDPCPWAWAITSAMAEAGGAFVTRSFERMLKDASGRKYGSLQTALKAYLGSCSDPCFLSASRRSGGALLQQLLGFWGTLSVFVWLSFLSTVVQWFDTCHNPALHQRMVSTSSLFRLAICFLGNVFLEPCTRDSYLSKYTLSHTRLDPSDLCIIMVHHAMAATGLLSETGMSAKSEQLCVQFFNSWKLFKPSETMHASTSSDGRTKWKSHEETLFVWGTEAA